MLLRVGLVGCGSMGVNHARILSSLEGVHLAGVADPASPKGLVPSCRVVRTPEELVTMGIDYVVIAAPSADHARIAIMFAEHGIHALIEKPLAMDEQSAAEILAAFERNDVLGGVGHVERYNSALLEMKRRILEQQLGAMFHISTRREGPFPQRISDTGVLMDLLTHDVDISMWISNSWYEYLAAFSSGVSGRSNEDIAFVNGRLGGGVLVSHSVNWISPYKERKVSITGERGTLVADLLMSELTFYSNERASQDWAEWITFRGVQMGDVTRYALNRREPLRLEHEAFRDALMGKPSSIVTLKEGLAAVRVAAAALRSEKRNCAEHLNAPS